jgi:hypothetical protein
MDLGILKAHEDRVVKCLEPLPRIEQLIALRYLRTLLGVSIDQTGTEIMTEFRK